MTPILEKLYSYSKFGIKLGLENMHKIMDSLGNPQNSYKVVHIAGTNGKGSVASIIESVLIAAGHNTGKYTSPHLIEFNERIVFNKTMISDSDIEHYFKIVEEKAVSIGIHPTFFEITTAMMFLYFKDCGADYVVLETGMGGRYDATNIITPVVSIITNVTMDHMGYLGDSVEKIGEEKAGIIKEGIVLISMEKKESVKEIFSSKAGKYFIDGTLKEYSFNLDSAELKTNVKVDNEIYTVSLYGDHQAENFIAAYLCCMELGIPKEFIKNGASSVYWPGRFEVVKKGNGNTIILDGAHNIDSADRLCGNVKRVYSRDEVILITSVLQDKEISEIVKKFSEFSSEALFISMDSYERGVSGEKLYKEYGRYFEKSNWFGDIDKAYEYAVTQNKAIIVAGSLYLVGKFKKEVLQLG